MFSKERLYKDLEVVCKATQSAYVNYTDVHTADAELRAQKTYDFVQHMQKIHKGLNPKTLKDSKFLCRDVNGTYKINILSEIENFAGGYALYFRHKHANRFGQAHSNLERKAGLLFFFGDETFLERQTVYHESGHLLQYKLKILSLKDSKEKCLAQKDCKFPKYFYYDYCTYLREAHADAFGYACMLLRAESRQERAQNTIYAYRRAGTRLLRAMKTNNVQYSSDWKYYSDFRTQKATIKEVNKWFVNGDISKYRDNNGEIDFEALALKVKEIVDEYAMSPNVFYNFMQGNSWRGFSLKEKNWQTSVPQAFIYSCADNANTSGLNKINAKINKHKEIDKKNWSTKFIPLEPYDEASEVLNTCCQLSDLHTKFMQMAAKEDIDISKYNILNIDNAVRYKKIPSFAIDTFVEQLKAEGKEISSEFLENLHNYIYSVNTVFHNNKAANLDILQASEKSNKTYDLMWQMYYTRRKNPQAKVDLEKLHSIIETPSVKRIHKHEMKIFDMLADEVVRNDAYDTLASSPEEARQMRSEVINLLPTLIFRKGSLYPDKVVDDMMDKVAHYDADAEEKLRLSLKKACTLHYVYGSTFESAIARYYQSLQNLNNKSSAEKSANNRLNKNSYNER